MAKVQPYASLYHKNEGVKKVFTFFEEVEKIKMLSEREELLMISETGRRFTHPRSNVVSGAP